jgi:cytochrome b
MTTQKRLVWDLPLRLFHWLLVLSIAASWYTAENSEEYVTAGENVYSYTQIHFWLGYWCLGLIAFRILWGFIGPKHARFASFLAGPGRLVGYGRTVFQRNSTPTVGHNPLGGWMVVVMILMIGAQAVTGLFLIDNTEIYSAPYHSAVAAETAGSLARFHHINFDVLLWVMGLHVLAILFYVVYKRQNLVGPMFTGSKAAMSVPEREAITGSQWLKALIVILVCAGGVYLVLKMAPPPPAMEEYY